MLPGDQFASPLVPPPSMALIQACEDGCRMTTSLPTANPEVLATWKLRDPTGTNDVVMSVRGETSVQPLPLPRTMAERWCGVSPTMRRTVPVVPSPTPRRTTPDLLTRNTPLIWYVPAFRTSAPRMPLASGVRLPTASSAAWMRAVWSPLVADSRETSGTLGIGSSPAL